MKERMLQLIEIIEGVIDDIPYSDTSDGYTESPISNRTREALSNLKADIQADED